MQVWIFQKFSPVPAPQLPHFYQGGKSMLLLPLQRPPDRHLGPSNKCKMCSSCKVGSVVKRPENECHDLLLALDGHASLFVFVECTFNFCDILHGCILGLFAQQRCFIRLRRRTLHRSKNSFQSSPIGRARSPGFFKQPMDTDSSMQRGSSQNPKR